MSIKVKTIDTEQVKEDLKSCPQSVQNYVKSLERLLEINKETLNRAIKKLREK